MWHGHFLLRIEDIDITRCTQALAQACLQDLAWLGLSWEEPVRWQSRHFDDYGQALATLRSMGLIYRCDCSRRAITERVRAQDPEGAPLYDGYCRHRNVRSDEPHCERLDMQKALNAVSAPLRYGVLPELSATAHARVADPLPWGDVVLARKEIPTSYHLSVVVDDALQGVTHIVRGEDLRAATDVHVLLQALLGLPTPVYHHHVLWRDAQGNKLSKSQNSKAISQWRSEGFSPESLRQLLGFGGAI